MSKDYLVPEKAIDYLEALAQLEHPALAELRKATETHPRRQMQISRGQGQLFQILIGAMRAERVLEVGVFTGYSSLAMALALGDQGSLIGLDISEEYTDVARKFWEQAGVAKKIDLRIGPALASLEALVLSGAKGTFDLVFIDADKGNIPAYYERALELLRPAGLVAIDNTLWDGKVYQPASFDADTETLRAFNAFIAKDNRVRALLLPFSDGITLALKR